MGRKPGREQRGRKERNPASACIRSASWAVLFCLPPPAVIDGNWEWKQVFPPTGCFLGICLNSEKANVVRPPFLDPSCPQGNLRKVSLSWGSFGPKSTQSFEWETGNEIYTYIHILQKKKKKLYQDNEPHSCGLSAKRPVKAKTPQSLNWVWNRPSLAMRYSCLS